MKKIIITVSVLVAIYFLIPSKKMETNLNSDLKYYYDSFFVDKKIPISGNLDKDINNWILQKEGGLTDNKNDSASKFPLIGTFTVNGKKYVNPHTNKGITYRTFIDTLPKMGIKPTNELFLSMPNNIVFDIYKKNYADAYKENSGNQMIDHMLGLWAWGSGVSGEKALVKSFEKLKGKTLNQLYKENKQKLFNDLVLYRIEFFKKIAEKNKNNKVFLKGWINSILNFHKYFNYYL